jgi:hypothetical protein
MFNPDYHPDKAHLPNKQDTINWNNGGKEKEAKAQAAIKRFADKYYKLNNK